MRGQPRRVLHVFRAMMRGGAETWLMNTLRRIDRGRVRMDFLVHTQDVCAYDAEIESLGGRIFRVCEPLHSLAYARAVGSLLREHRFDAVHSHVHHFSGYLVALAAAANVPIRIAHSHNDTSHIDSSAGWLRRLYLELTERLVRCYASRMVGVSRLAGNSLFGAGWLRDPRSKLMHCGIDLSAFQRTPRRSEVRKEWGFGEQELVIGHVGRLASQKNHLFLVEVAAEVARRRPDTRVLLVGDGPLRLPVLERARQLGIEERVILTGVRQDVPRQMAAMDIFLFPSHHEGLPLSLVEAQAAGLPCVISDVISGEADVNPRLISRLALSEGPRPWAEAVLNASRTEVPARHYCVAAVEDGGFNIDKSAEDIYALYQA